MLQGLAILGELLRQELQGHIAAQAGVFSFVDHTHPTAAYFLKYLVMADGRTDHKLPPSFRQIGLAARGRSTFSEDKVVTQRH